VQPFSSVITPFYTDLKDHNVPGSIPVSAKMRLSSEKIIPRYVMAGYSCVSVPRSCPPIVPIFFICESEEEIN